MKLWWWHDANRILPAALPLQLAFALNLAVNASGDAGIQLAISAGEPRGLRIAGAAVGLTGLLNLALSITAMKMGSLWGIAMATVVAQSILSIVASFYTCRYMKLPWLPWLVKGWLFPLAGISFAGWLRMRLAPLNIAAEHSAAHRRLHRHAAGRSLGSWRQSFFHQGGTQAGPRVYSQIML